MASPAAPSRPTQGRGLLIPAEVSHCFGRYWKHDRVCQECPGRRDVMKACRAESGATEFELPDLSPLIAELRGP